MLQLRWPGWGTEAAPENFPRGRGMQLGCAGNLKRELETQASGDFQMLFAAQTLALEVPKKLKWTDGALGPH